MQDMKQTIRISLTAYGEDWQEFRELADLHGYSISELFTQNFYETLNWLRDTPPAIKTLRINHG